MKLWLLSQDVNDGYDTYDAAVVAAETEEEARCVHVGSMWPDNRYGSWVTPEHVKVQLLGDPVDGTLAGIVLGSFNAG